jgi:predicted secreted protein
MQPVAVPAASVRLAASLVALLLLAVPALAGDRALIDFIGYSEDGKYFAFEEYGVQDGSGFVYSSIYVIDLVADKWTSGTPFKVQSGEDDFGDDLPIAMVRAAARAKAADKLEEYNIEAPVEIVYLRGEGTGSDAGTSVTWSTPSCCGPGQVQDDSFTLRLDTQPITSSEDYCADMDPVGYRLTIEDANGTRTLHADGDTLPRTRGCTLDYRIYAVLQPFSYFEGPRVAIIATYPLGFEGPDRRFLAVPIDAP